MVQFFPTRAQFSATEKIEFTCADTHAKRCELSLIRDGIVVATFDLDITNNSLQLPDTLDLEKGGYLCSATFDDGTTAQTALDIDSGMIRYGFLSDFSVSDADKTEALTWLAKLHLNYVQYYDWMYKHDDLIPPSTVFEDLLGRKLSLDTVKARIRQAQSYGMKSMAYGAIYGATPAFAEQHSEWRMYDEEGNPIGFYDFLSIMNPTRGSGWHDHLLSEYAKAVEIGFDGIHMDTYGYPKFGYSADGSALDLPTCFGELIDDAKDKLVQSNPGAQLIFNNVGNWPVASVANRKQEAIYIEVWDPYSDYRALEEIIKSARYENSSIPIILAAYLKPFESEVTVQTWNSYRLLTAVITVLGASHLINGEDGGIITEGYYAKYFSADEYGRNLITTYYDYITSLAHLWNDNQLEDVTRTYWGGDNREVVTDETFLSPYPQAGKLWMNIRTSSQKMFLNLVNFTAAKDSLWNAPKDVEETGECHVKILLHSPIQSLRILTPDAQNGVSSQELSYTLEDSEFGQYAVIAVPKISVWSSVLIDFAVEEK